MLSNSVKMSRKRITKNVLFFFLHSTRFLDINNPLIDLSICLCY